MEFEMICRHCGEKFTIRVYPGDGYIELGGTENTAELNRFTDGSATVDFFCSQACKNGE